MEWRDPIDFTDYLNYQIEKVTDEIETATEDVKRNLDYMKGRSLSPFCAARDSKIEELTALYAELRRLYETQRAYEYYQKKER